MPEKLQRATIIIVCGEGFSKVRRFLEKEDIDFFVIDPLLNVSAIKGVKLLKE